MPDWPLAVARSICRARGLLTQRQAQHIWGQRIFCCLVVGRLAASYQWRRSWEHAIESGPADGLSRAAAGRRHPRNLAVPGVVCRILLDLPLGDTRRVHWHTGHYCDANNVRPVRRQSLARGAALRFGKPEIGPVAPFYFTMSCSLMTDRLSVHGDPLRRKHSHAPVRAVRKCLYVEIGGKVVGRAHHRRWG